MASQNLKNQEQQGKEYSCSEDDVGQSNDDDNDKLDFSPLQSDDWESVESNESDQIDEGVPGQLNEVENSIIQLPESNEKQCQRDSKIVDEKKSPLVHLIKNNSQQDKKRKQSTDETIFYVKKGMVVKQVVPLQQSNKSDKQIRMEDKNNKLDHAYSVEDKQLQQDFETFEPICAEEIENTGSSLDIFAPLISFSKFKSIVQDRCIRPHWSCKVHKDNVSFAYVDFEKSKIKCYLEVDEDFSVNARTADKIISMYIHTSNGVKSINELIKVMKSLENKKWCNGPDLPTVSRSANCTGVLSLRASADSCIACIKERIKIQARNIQLEKHKKKYSELKYKFDRMRSKQNYASNQYERLKAENKELSMKLRNAKKAALDDVFSQLPSLQQQIVRYMINFCYTKKNALRYDIPWINECIVMRAKSSSLYEYMRQKEILPLPCIDTLKKYKFTFVTSENDEVADSPMCDETFDSADLPESTDTPESPEIPESSEIPKYPEIPDYSEIPGPSEILESSKTLEFTEIPASMKMLESTEILDPTEIFESLEVPELFIPIDSEFHI